MPKKEKAVLSPQLHEFLVKETAAHADDGALGARSRELAKADGEKIYMDVLRDEGGLSRAALAERHVEYRGFFQDALANVAALNPEDVKDGAQLSAFGDVVRKSHLLRQPPEYDAEVAGGKVTTRLSETKSFLVWLKESEAVGKAKSSDVRRYFDSLVRKLGKEEAKLVVEKAITSSQHVLKWKLKPATLKVLQGMPRPDEASAEETADSAKAEAKELAAKLKRLGEKGKADGTPWGVTKRKVVSAINSYPDPQVVRELMRDKSLEEPMLKAFMYGARPHILAALRAAADQASVDEDGGTVTDTSSEDETAAGGKAKWYTAALPVGQRKTRRHMAVVGELYAEVTKSAGTQWRATVTGLPQTVSQHSSYYETEFFGSISKAKKWAEGVLSREAEASADEFEDDGETSSPHNLLSPMLRKLADYLDRKYTADEGRQVAAALMAVSQMEPLLRYRNDLRRLVAQASADEFEDAGLTTHERMRSHKISGSDLNRALEAHEVTMLSESGGRVGADELGFLIKLKRGGSGQLVYVPTTAGSNLGLGRNMHAYRNVWDFFALAHELKIGERAGADEFEDDGTETAETFFDSMDPRTNRAAERAHESTLDLVDALRRERAPVFMSQVARAASRLITALFRTHDGGEFHAHTSYALDTVRKASADRNKWAKSSKSTASTDEGADEETGSKAVGLRLGSDVAEVMIQNRGIHNLPKKALQWLRRATDRDRLSFVEGVEDGLSEYASADETAAESMSTLAYSVASQLRNAGHAGRLLAWLEKANARKRKDFIEQLLLDLRTVESSVDDVDFEDDGTETALMGQHRGNLQKLSREIAKAISRDRGLIKQVGDWMEGASRRDRLDFFDWLEDSLHQYEGASVDEETAAGDISKREARRQVERIDRMIRNLEKKRDLNPAERKRLAVWIGEKDRLMRVASAEDEEVAAQKHSPMDWRKAFASSAYLDRWLRKNKGWAIMMEDQAGTVHALLYQHPREIVLVVATMHRRDDKFMPEQVTADRLDAYMNNYYSHSVVRLGNYRKQIGPWPDGSAAAGAEDETAAGYKQTKSERSRNAADQSRQLSEQLSVKKRAKDFKNILSTYPTDAIKRLMGDKQLMKPVIRAWGKSASKWLDDAVSARASADEVADVDFEGPKHDSQVTVKKGASLWIGKVSYFSQMTGKLTVEFKVDDPSGSVTSINLKRNARVRGGMTGTAPRNVIRQGDNVTIIDKRGTAWNGQVEGQPDGLHTLRIEGLVPLKGKLNINPRSSKWNVVHAAADEPQPRRKRKTVSKPSADEFEDA